MPSRERLAAVEAAVRRRGVRGRGAALRRSRIARRARRRLLRARGAARRPAGLGAAARSAARAGAGGRRGRERLGRDRPGRRRRDGPSVWAGDRERGERSPIARGLRAELTWVNEHGHAAAAAPVRLARHRPRPPARLGLLAPCARPAGSPTTRPARPHPRDARAHPLRPREPAAGRRPRGRPPGGADAGAARSRGAGVAAGGVSLRCSRRVPAGCGGLGELAAGVSEARGGAPERAPRHARRRRGAT